MSWDWETTGFQPDSSGWRAVYVSTDGAIVSPVAGWLLQQEVECDARGNPKPPTEPIPYCRVVAADADGAELVRVDEAQNFWLLLAPGEPEPSAEAVAAELRRREKPAESKTPKEQR